MMTYFVLGVIPDNPKDVYYLRVCYGCSEPAQEGQPHSQHYGGIACLSCRAFFRRAQQSAKHPSFICKNNGNCVITVKNRRQCQKCRYEQCLRTGFNPTKLIMMTINVNVHARFRALRPMYY